MSLYQASVVPMTKTLQNVSKWLDKGAEFAKAKGFDPNTLVTARLAPDAYPLLRQVQTVCDTAKFTAARLTGKEAPKHADTEQTFEELGKRVQSCLAYLATVKEADFAGAEDRRVELPFLENQVILGIDYVHEMALPNFYFHAATLYQILRHNGVELGKRDFISSLTTQPR